jgi:phosphate transport system substrate-binding protein
MGFRIASHRARTWRALGAGVLSAATALSAVATTSASAVSSKVTAHSSSPSVTLNGAGSTFDQPLFTRAFYFYHKAHSNITINYASIGSGGGEQQFEAGTVNFGASDVPMLPADLAKVPQSAGPVLQVPVALGGEAIAYNLVGLKTGMHITPAVLAGIFLGQITNWDDPSISALNPGVSFPNEAITVVHRADASGTSYIFTNYLAEISTTWASKVGIGKSVAWPVGLGGQGNEGVAGAVQQTPGSIGYVELAYIVQNPTIQDFALQNPKGAYVLPSQASVAADAALHPGVSATNFSITNLGGSKKSYPISGYSWTIILQNQTNTTAGTALVNMLYWLTRSSGGQGSAGKIGYVPLPSNIQKLAQTTLLKVVGSNGEKLLKIAK